MVQSPTHSSPGLDEKNEQNQFFRQQGIYGDALIHGLLGEIHFLLSAATTTTTTATTTMSGILTDCLDISIPARVPIQVAIEAHP